jgi:hypothetical protein
LVESLRYLNSECGKISIKFFGFKIEFEAGGEKEKNGQEERSVDAATDTE